jgi:hypothetical protein
VTFTREWPGDDGEPGYTLEPDFDFLRLLSACPLPVNREPSSD